MQGDSKVVHLILRPVSQESLHAIEAIKRRILSGETIGLAWVEMHALKDWTYDAAGACKTHPTLTRGHVCGLSDELAKLPDIP